jgi:tetratricopeptide (TPR) repeat protein
MGGSRLAMKYGLLVSVLGMMLLCSVTNAKLQDEDETTIYVYSDYASIDPEYVEDFYTYVGAHLEEQGVELEIVDFESRRIAQVSILFFPEFDSERVISSARLEISFLHDPDIQLSPILFDTFSEVVDISAPIEYSTQMATALLLYGIGRCDLATPYFLEVQTDDWDVTNPNYANFYLGNCALAAQNYDVAIGYFEYALYDYGGAIYKRAAFNLAWAYLQADQEEAAFGLMNDFVENDKLSERKDALIQDLIFRAQLYALAFRFDEAIADMDTAIELEPDNPELYVQRGQIILLLYEWDRVLADYNRAIELDPDYADAYYYRGVLFYTQAHRAEALPDFQRYLELAPDGDHSADAAQYVTDIQRELDSLTEP